MERYLVLCYSILCYLVLSLLHSPYLILPYCKNAIPHVITTLRHSCLLAIIFINQHVYAREVASEWVFSYDVTPYCFYFLGISWRVVQLLVLLQPSELPSVCLCVCVRLCVCLSVCVCVNVCVCVRVGMYARVVGCGWACISLSAYLSITPSICPRIHLSIPLFGSLTVLTSHPFLQVVFCFLSRKVLRSGQLSSLGDVSSALW